MKEIRDPDYSREPIVQAVASAKMHSPFKKGKLWENSAASAINVNPVGTRCSASLPIRVFSQLQEEAPQAPGGCSTFAHSDAHELKLR